mgnify:CR=1 FL=1
MSVTALNPILPGFYPDPSAVVVGDDFYIECAPGCSKEQIAVNKRLKSISDAFKIPMVIGTDAHYLKKEDRFVHKAYLNSKGGEREVDDFYEFSYLQTEDDVYVKDKVKLRFSSLTTMMNEFFKDMKDTGFDINQVLEGCDEEMYKELIKHYYNDESEEE